MKICRDCPYRLGTLKSEKAPCIECHLKNLPKSPFSSPVLISEGTVCEKCGSNRFINGKCAACGSKAKRKLF